MIATDSERREGYQDAMADLETMLSCPVCHAIQYREQTGPMAPGYGQGWRIAMLEVVHEWSHTCGKKQQPCN